jgi:DNA-binding transcriptional MerR regulator
MDAEPKSRLLSIGEFATATQLSPKALRLYDEQRILCPAVVEAANGYRYYRSDQIALGRLIRTLRDMDLPLARIQEFVSAPDPKRAQVLLRELADDNERRIARQRSAYQSALTLLQSSPVYAPVIAIRERTATTIAVRPFLAERRILTARFDSEVKDAQALLIGARVKPTGAPFCILVDPLSEEESRAEVAIPVAPPSAIPSDVALRQLPARRCAVMTVDTDSETVDFAAATDSLFDWFDRHGYHAVEAPSISFTEGAGIELSWAFEPAFPASSR